MPSKLSALKDQFASIRESLNELYAEIDDTELDEYKTDVLQGVEDAQEALDYAAFNLPPDE